MNVKPDQYLSLQTVLKASNGPLDEIQVWSLCYQLLKYTGFFDISDSLSCRSQYLKSTERPSVANVYIYKNGEVRCGSEAASCSNVTDDEMMMWLNQLGSLLYHCLDFGLAEGVERDLSESLCNLIEVLTAPLVTEKEDEGIEGDEESGLTNVIANVKQMCESVSEDRGQQPGSHHAAVCRALYWHVRELLDFLDGVRDGEANSEEERRLRELDQQMWATLWSQVMEDLRRGVRLRAVKNAEQLPSQRRLFELTPYEMLLEDIRLRRYKLRRTERTEVPWQLRASAHELILEYIRSRPPLKPVNHRVLGGPPISSQTPRDQTLEAIRKGDFKLKVVARPVENKCALPRRRRRRRVIKPEFNLDDLSDEDEACPQLWDLIMSSSTNSLATPPPADDLRASVRRRISPMVTPEIRALRRTSFSSDGDLRRGVGQRSVRELRRESHCGSMSCQMTRRALPSDVMAHNSGDEFSESPMSSPMMSRPRHSMSVVSPSLLENPVTRRGSLDASLLWRSGRPVIRERGERCRPAAIRDSGVETEAQDRLNSWESEEGDLADSSVFPSAPTSTSTNCDEDRPAPESDLGVGVSPFRRQVSARTSVRLSLSEVSLIRSTLARAEVETMTGDKKLAEKIKKERICFLCRKTEFGLLRWGKRCCLCLQMVCAACRTKANLPSNKSSPLGDFFVNTLAPADQMAAVLPDAQLGSTEAKVPRVIGRHQSFLGSDHSGQRSESGLMCRRCACIGYVTGQ